MKELEIKYKNLCNKLVNDTTSKGLYKIKFKPNKEMKAVYTVRTDSLEKAKEILNILYNYDDFVKYNNILSSNLSLSVGYIEVQKDGVYIKY